MTPSEATQALQLAVEVLHKRKHDLVQQLAEVTASITSLSSILGTIAREAVPPSKQAETPQRAAEPEVQEAPAPSTPAPQKRRRYPWVSDEEILAEIVTFPVGETFSIYDLVCLNPYARQSALARFKKFLDSPEARRVKYLSGGGESRKVARFGLLNENGTSPTWRFPTNIDAITQEEIRDWIVRKGHFDLREAARFMDTKYTPGVRRKLVPFIERGLIKEVDSGVFEYQKPTPDPQVTRTGDPESSNGGSLPVPGTGRSGTLTQSKEYNSLLKRAGNQIVVEGTDGSGHLMIRCRATGKQMRAAKTPSDRHAHKRLKADLEAIGVQL